MYPYTALDDSLQEIRVLSLLPSDKLTTDIRCSINTVSLANQPEYRALSYVWGGSTKDQKISIDGYEMPVTDNLFKALFQLRGDNDALTIWIDAVCINQQDVLERGSQVKLMRQIYSNAQDVIMWLGESDADTKNAMIVCRLFGAMLAKGMEVEISPELDAAYIQMMEDRKSGKAEHFWHSWINLFTRPYWNRVWILQEIILARSATVHCGRFSHSWVAISSMLQDPRTVHSMLSTAPWDEGLARALSSARTISKSAFDHQQKVELPLLRESVRHNANLMKSLLKKDIANTDIPQNQALALEQFSQGITLPKALALGRQRQATDPRDHLYGVFGLVGGQTPAADYTISKSKAYTDMAIYLIESTKTLDVLSFCKGECKRPNDLPSWVPDWSINMPENEYLVTYDRPWRHFNAWGGVPPSYSISSDGKSLAVDAVCMDTISAAADSPNPTTIAQDLQAIFRYEWAFWLANKSDKNNDSGLDQRNAFMINAGIGTFILSLEDSLPHLAWSTFWNRMMAWHETPEAALKDESMPSNVLEWIEYTATAILQRGVRTVPKFFITEGGNMGRGPRNLEVGDHVAVLRGGYVPFILRSESRSSEDDSFRLVGECYSTACMISQMNAELNPIIESCVRRITLN